MKGAAPDRHVIIWLVAGSTFAACTARRQKTETQRECSESHAVHRLLKADAEGESGEHEGQDEHDGDAVKVALHHCRTRSSRTDAATEHVGNSTTTTAMQQHQDDDGDGNDDVEDDESNGQHGENASSGIVGLGGG